MATITGKPLLICEGPEERALVEAMVSDRALQPFDLLAISDLNTGGGITALRHFLPALAALPNFHMARNFCLLADNNGDHKQQLRVIQDEIRRANGHAKVNGYFPIPRSRFRKWMKRGISFTVILHPCDGAAGCLETVIWRAFSRLHPQEAACVEATVQCGHLVAKGWNVSKRDKARVRAGIAILNRRNPALALTLLWKNAANIVPIHEPEFNDHFLHLSAV